jgi:hypothetical protein
MEKLNKSNSANNASFASLFGRCRLLIRLWKKLVADLKQLQDIQTQRR